MLRHRAAFATADNRVSQRLPAAREAFVYFPVARSPRSRGGERMLLYEILIAIGIVVVLVVAAIDRLAARVMMGPEEMALLRLARAATAQRCLVASAAQQEREARAAATQRRLVAYWTHALAAPLPARLAALITQLETQEVSAYGLAHHYRVADEMRMPTRNCRRGCPVPLISFVRRITN
jgi:hypothetical protein